jgi:hypothetical protein
MWVRIFKMCVYEVFTVHYMYHHEVWLLYTVDSSAIMHDQLLLHRRTVLTIRY